LSFFTYLLPVAVEFSVLKSKCFVLIGGLLVRIEIVDDVKELLLQFGVHWFVRVNSHMRKQFLEFGVLSIGVTTEHRVCIYDGSDPLSVLSVRLVEVLGGQAHDLAVCLLKLLL